MQNPLEAFFSLFGKKAIGQIIGATVIGAILVALTLAGSGKRPPVGDFATWLVGGAAAGFTAGVILVSPRVVFATLFGLLGLAIAILPMSQADGTPTTLLAQAVKVGVGAAFMLLSIFLVYLRLKKMGRDQNCEPVAAPNGGPAAARDSRASDGPPSVS